MSVQRRRGNELERAIARRLGGQRTGQYGGEDVAHEWLSIECKSRKALPAWLREAMRQAESHASADKLAITVLHELGEAHNDDLVVMRLRDFEEWFGGEEER